MNRRTLSELISTTEPAWPLVQKWINDAQNHVEVMPSRRSNGEDTLLFLQVTTRSPMGAIALETGGIVVDHGWIRILGACSDRLTEGLVAWNAQSSWMVAPLKDALIVAHDVMGGFFAINGGAFKGHAGQVFYWAPDTLRWEDLNLSYSDFLNWTFQGDLATFYGTSRWPHWEKDVDVMSGDAGMSIWPPLWAMGPGVQERSRRIVPMKELWNFQQDIAANMNDLPSGTAIRLKFNDHPMDLQKA